MSVRRLLRTVLLVTLAFATASPGLVATVATVTFVSAGCGPDGGSDEAGGPEQSLAEIARSVESGVNDSKNDSPNHPTLIGPIGANAPERAQFRGPDRRFLAWIFSAEEQVPVSIRSRIEARPSAGTFVQILWHPSCTDPWRTVDIAAGSLSRDLPTAGGDYLLVSGPRSTNTSGTLEATLGVSAEEAAMIVGPRCRPGAGDRPAVPDALDPETTATVGSIGARFAVTQAGTASYSVPIVTPPGRAGIEPSLAVTYDSGGGNGILGVRFGLSGLSGITRCNRDVVRDGRHEPPALRDSDAYCIDGARLVPGGNGPGGSVWYATESESYARITPVGAGPGGPESFKVEAKDGRILEYGTSDDSRLFAKPVPSDGADVIRTWALKRVSDRSGNWMEYTYEKTLDLRVASIVYTGSSVAPALAPNREVRFKYRPRKDSMSGWYLGQQVGRDSLLETITIFGPSPTPSGAHGAVGELGLRTYTFGYREADGGHTTEYPDSQTRLTSITECGRIQQRPSGSSESGCKPPTRFDWNGNGTAPSFAGPQQQMRVRADVSGWPADRRPISGLFDASGRLSRWGRQSSLEGPKGLVQPIDLDGDGRTDILYPGPSSWLVAHALPGGGFATIDTGITGPVSPIDYDADGRTDLLLHAQTDLQVGVPSSHWTVRLSNGAGFDATPIDTGWDATGLLWNPQMPSQIYTRVLDFDGDGRDDVLYCLPGRGWVVGLGGLPSPVEVRRGSCEDSLLFIDIDGDGDVDVLDESSLGIAVERLREPNFTLRDENGVEQSVPIQQSNRVVDINGDGLPDVLHSALRPVLAGAGGSGGAGGNGGSGGARVDGSGNLNLALSIWINRGDRTFEEQPPLVERVALDRFGWPLGTPINPSPQELADAEVLDVDHDGRPDLLLPGRILYSESSLTGAVRLVRGPSLPWELAPGQMVTRTIPVDLNGDGHAELLGVGETSSLLLGTPATEPANHVVVAIREGLLPDPSQPHPPTFSIDYRPMIDRDVYTPTLAHFTAHPQPGTTPVERWRSACSGAWRCPEWGRYLVAQVDADNGLYGPTDTVGQSTTRYSYADARIHVQGWGGTGFGQRTVSVMEHPSADPHRITQTDYANADHRTARIALRQETTVGQRVETTTTTPVVEQPSPPRWHTRIASTKSVVKENGVTLREVESSENFDPKRGCTSDATTVHPRSANEGMSTDLTRVSG